MMIAVCTSVSEGQIGALSLDHVNFQEELAFKKGYSMGIVSKCHSFHFPVCARVDLDPADGSDGIWTFPKAVTKVY